MPKPPSAVPPASRGFSGGSGFGDIAAAAAVRRSDTPRARRAWTAARARLLGWGKGHSTDAPLASLIASLWTGAAALPPRLGLRAWSFRSLVRRSFPGWPKGRAIPMPRRAAACRLHEPGIAAERAGLEALLRSGCAAPNPHSHALARVLAAGCLGYGHMWRDMGFSTRAELRAMLFAVAPRLARRNVHDMKWKKFLYRELCRSEAGYVCRSPSCDACPGYADCFGPEA
ncbi:nitrogen fixation protein NifQ [Oleispirillum naphthae]|uniref:nitrogen fixation protein NifQ n=1 Tax=Oleispirillum naphthae TaxID=2838853 RepID=UPI003082556D